MDVDKKIQLVVSTCIAFWYIALHHNSINQIKQNRNVSTSFWLHLMSFLIFIQAFIKDPLDESSDIFLQHLRMKKSNNNNNNNYYYYYNYYYHIIIIIIIIIIM